MDPATPAELISVVVPMHNEVENVATLVEAIERAVAGAGRPFELILVDDSTTDGSDQALEQLAATRPWLDPLYLRICLFKTTEIEKKVLILFYEKMVQ